MKSKFPERVELERSAMDMVNGSGLFDVELVGVGALCVKQWLAFAAKSFEGEADVQQLQQALVDVARACHSEADVSDEIFTDIDPGASEIVLSRLARALDALRPV